MNEFRNFKTACQHYKFPGSHQVGSFGDKHGILRSYSNGTPGKDFINDDETQILYRLKNEEYRTKFSRNIASGQLVRVFRKVETGVKDLGLFVVQGFGESGHVKMVLRQSASNKGESKKGTKYSKGCKREASERELPKRRTKRRTHN